MYDDVLNYRTSVGLCWSGQFIQEGFHIREMLRNCTLQEVKQGSVMDGFCVYELVTHDMGQCNIPEAINDATYFVDTADPETERTTLDPSAIHIIADQKYQLLIARSANLFEMFAGHTLSSSLKCLA